MRILIATIIIAFGVVSLGTSPILAQSFDSFLIYHLGEDKIVTISDPHQTIDQVSTWTQQENDNVAIFIKILMNEIYTPPGEIIVQTHEPGDPEYTDHLLNLQDTITIYPIPETPPDSANIVQDMPQQPADLEELKISEDVLEDLKLCHSGFGHSRTIQGVPYSVEWEEFADYYLYTSLDKRHKIDQFCIAQKYINASVTAMYPGMILDDEYEERPTLDDTRYYPQKSVTPEEIKSQAADAADFMCSIAGKQRGLCTNQEFSGINRGNPEVINNLDSYNQYISDLAASIQTEQDKINAYEKARDAMCVYMIHYEHMIETDNFPKWLNHCIG